MKRPVPMPYIIMTLIVTSIFLYIAHYLIFHDAHHIFIFMVHDLAFLPLEVLLVAIIIERMLNYREKQMMMQKLNMVIGTFFSELGSDLMAVMTAGAVDRREICQLLSIQPEWKEKDFINSLQYTKKQDFAIDHEAIDFQHLLRLLADKRDFLVMLLANPNVLEHEDFTQMLWAVFHLLEELSARETFDGLSEHDKKHLANDAKRVYVELAGRWLLYLRHLQQEYPYMFSLVLRTHPLYRDATCELDEA